MSAEPVRSLPWIPREDARVKYEKDGEKEAYGGQTVSGRVLEVSEREGAYGDYLIWKLEVEGVGHVSIHAQPQVLAGKLDGVLKNGLNYGDKITVSYTGEVMGGSGRTYSNYEVLFDRPFGSPILIPGRNTPSHGQAPPPPAGDVAVQQQDVDDDIPF